MECKFPFLPRAAHVTVLNLQTPDFQAYKWGRSRIFVLFEAEINI